MESIIFDISDPKKDIADIFKPKIILFQWSL